MKNKNKILSLSVDCQNLYCYTSLAKAKDAAKEYREQYAEQSREFLREYLLRDYDANPEGWDDVFQYAYSEISARAKDERRNVLIRALSF